MRYVILLLILFLSGCKSTAPELKIEERTLSQHLVQIAKENTNFIGKIRMDNRPHYQHFDNSGIDLTELWFVTGDGLLSDRNGYAKLKKSLSEFCEINGGRYSTYEVKGDFEVLHFKLPTMVSTIHAFASRDERVFIHECNGSKAIKYSIALNHGDSETTAADTVVAKVRVAAFENNGNLSNSDFRNSYDFILGQVTKSWLSTY
ncbi:hypothetical protein L3V43_17710 [Pseudoalteromonas sp. L23]|uniref:hypothetical protein n=1 Tax=Pseudoalteromonas TaxID=53246 RepID=UPI001EEF8EF5|nr:MULTISPECIES: hypothetical protein [unclassified Pseudoalteromonas]MCF7515334.1 hypothetical protein [Pseudoalteromonas sp. L7]MCF7527487.1 hypothetical protein [Pseudoalteromonas sp. L23]MCX2767595.1 hypothetical protein [Pseudoalteromonas sp. B530]